MILENVTTIVTQPQIEEKIIFQIARDTNAKLAKLTPLIGINNITNYIQMIEQNVLALLNPEDIEDSGWITTALIIGLSFFGVTVATLAYFRYKK